jgi:hypothetical protein
LQITFRPLPYKKKSGVSGSPTGEKQLTSIFFLTVSELTEKIARGLLKRRKAPGRVLPREESRSGSIFFSQITSWLQ